MSESESNGIKWFKDAKVGMFCHYGLYALLGENENLIRKKVSKAEYRKLMDRFDPKGFNAEEWVACAASMGAKYLVPTSRHAEGFCLWDTKLSKYKSTNTPCGRDLIAELAKACEGTEIQLCLYFNLETWLNEGNDIWNEMGLTYAEYIEGQLTEVLTNYGKIGLIWFDHCNFKEIPYERLQQIHKHIKSIQPDCLVDERGKRKSDPPIGDFITMERTFPDSDPSLNLVIECCDAMGVRSWGYDKEGAFWSVAELAKRVSICASNGYNYLLNVEPEPNGRIRPECVERARLLGDWIRANKCMLDSESIQVKPKDANISDHPEIGVCTVSGTTLNVFLHQWPVSDEIILPVTGELVDDNFSVKQTDEGLVVGGLPAMASAGSSPWVLSIDFKEVPKFLNTATEKINYPDASGNVFLSPLDAARESENGILQMMPNYFPDGRISMGSLHHINDKLIWNVHVDADSKFDVNIALGSIDCQDDAGFEISAGDSMLTARSWLTEHYSKPETRCVGQLELKKGDNCVVLRVTDFGRTSFSDVHGIWLVAAT